MLNLTIVEASSPDAGLQGRNPGIFTFFLSVITQQLAVNLSNKLSGLNRRAGAGQDSLRVEVDVTLNYRRTDNFPFGDNIKNLEFDYVLVLRDDEGKIHEYHSRKEAAYYMFANIPETQEEYFQMEKALVVRGG